MKRFFIGIAMAIVSVALYAGSRSVAVFTLDHQMSQSCEKKIKTNLRYEKGVSNIDVSLKENTITITYSTDKTDGEQLVKAFKKIGFNAELLKTSDLTDKKEKKK